MQMVGTILAYFFVVMQFADDKSTCGNGGNQQPNMTSTVTAMTYTML